MHRPAVTHRWPLVSRNGWPLGCWPSERSLGGGLSRSNQALDEMLCGFSWRPARTPETWSLASAARIPGRGSSFGAPGAATWLGVCCPTSSTRTLVRMPRADSPLVRSPVGGREGIMACAARMLPSPTIGHLSIAAAEAPVLTARLSPLPAGFGHRPDVGCDRGRHLSFERYLVGLHVKSARQH